MADLTLKFRGAATMERVLTATLAIINRPTAVFNKQGNQNTHYALFSVDEKSNGYDVTLPGFRDNATWGGINNWILRGLGFMETVPLRSGRQSEEAQLFVGGMYDVDFQKHSGSIGDGGFVTITCNNLNPVPVQKVAPRVT